MMDKKGQIFEKEQMKMFMYAIVVIFVALIISVAFSQGIDRKVDTYEYTQQIYSYRLFSSPDCFSDGSGVIYLDKFYNENLEECMNLPSDTKAGIELTLYDIEENEIGLVEINPSVVAQKITCDLSSSKVDCYKTRKYILYNDGVENIPGILDMVVITRV